MIRTYTELSKLNTFEDRFNYLQLNGAVCAETFGYERYLNQIFYRSKEWRSIRNKVIARDNGCDLGIADCNIFDRVIIHHMNPLTAEDIETQSEFLMNPEFLVCVSHDTHNAIHYGDISIARNYQLTERSPNDTCPWRK